GIKNFIGMQGFEELEPKEEARALVSSPHESELLLRRLQASGLKIGPGDWSRMDLGISDEDTAAMQRWVETRPSDQGREWIAIGPGSKMPAKRWPLTRFEEVVTALITEFDIW